MPFESKQIMHLKRVINFPNILTLIRLVFSPLVLPILLVVFLPENKYEYNLILTLLFILLSLTDFFDGYLARKYKQETNFGKLLDPIADKFLMFSSVISLVFLNKIYFYWGIIFIGREFLVLGLREIALSNGFDLPVNFWGKLKTVLQMSYLSFVILNGKIFFNLKLFFYLEYFLLFLSILFTIISGYIYSRQFIYKWKDIH